LNTSSAEAGLALLKEMGVITEWHVDLPNAGYNLIHQYWDKNKTHPVTTKGFLSMKVIQGISLPTDLTHAVTEIFSLQNKAMKEANIEKMVEGKLHKLLDRLQKIDNAPTYTSYTIRHPELIGAEIGWVKVRLKLMEEGKRLTKKDMLSANKLWSKYK